MSVLWILSLASFTCLALADYNFSVPLSGPNITFVGPNWLPEQAAGPCSTALGRFTGSPGEYVTLLFSGVGVYVVSFLQGDSSLVVAAIDGNSFSIDPRQSASPSCAILFSQSGLSNTMHNLTMMHNGPISHLILHIADILVARPGDAPPGLTQSTTPSPTTFTPITFVPTDNASRTNSPTSFPSSARSSSTADNPASNIATSPTSPPSSARSSGTPGNPTQTTSTPTDPNNPAKVWGPVIVGVILTAVAAVIIKKYVAEKRAAVQTAN